MNKLFGLFLGILIFAVAAAGVNALPTLIGGTIYYTNLSGVDGASVHVVCEHAGLNSSADTVSASNGVYFVTFMNSPSMECDFGDHAWVTATKDSSTGTNDGTVSICGGEICPVNVGLIDVTIPEFGLMGAMLVTLAGIGIVAYKRKN